ncbi:MAG: dipeptide epimerase [Rubripirellula sp.]|nr:dipeptide epimerase [Planctomycetaceae bacterium]MDF1842488.1 dipeptide epimerase [Rubripirellula sp.]
MLSLQSHTFDLPLKHPFTISRSTIYVQPTLVVELSDGTHHGYGEATTNDYYGMTLDRMVKAIESVRSTVESIQAVNPNEIFESVRVQLADEPFALCALDQAVYDLWGKQKGKPVYELWGLDPNDAPRSNFTIGIDSIAAMIAKLEEAPGWPTYKIKLGTKHDIEIVEQLRQHTDAKFRVDANCGWTVPETITNSHRLRELGVEFIEQPLPADQVEESREVFQKSALPIIADESCIVEDDVDHCAGRFHGVNIKLVKCGGMTPAKRMIQRARELNMKAMVGCMTESSVGISAIAQLAPLLDYVDMDGAALLANDIASGVDVQKGVCHFPTANGNGVTLTPK